MKLAEHSNCGTLFICKIVCIWMSVFLYKIDAKHWPVSQNFLQKFATVRERKKNFFIHWIRTVLVEIYICFHHIVSQHCFDFTRNVQHETCFAFDLRQCLQWFAFVVYHPFNNIHLMVKFATIFALDFSIRNEWGANKMLSKLTLIEFITSFFCVECAFVRLSNFYQLSKYSFFLWIWMFMVFVLSTHIQMMSVQFDR